MVGSPTYGILIDVDNKAYAVLILDRLKGSYPVKEFELKEQHGMFTICAINNHFGGVDNRDLSFYALGLLHGLQVGE